MYKRLYEIVHAQVIARRQADFGTELGSLDSAFKLAGMRGEISGLQLAIAIPDAMIADLRRDIDALMAKEREETWKQSQTLAP